MRDAPAGEFLRINRTFHQVSRSENTEPLKMSCGRDGRDFLSDMQPRRGRFLADKIQGLMSRVVRADQKLSARPHRNVRRCQQEPPRVLPAICFDVAHVLRQRIRMHRDLRMIVRTQQRCALDTYRPIAQRRAFSADGDNSDVPGIFHHFRYAASAKMRTAWVASGLAGKR